MSPKKFYITTAIDYVNSLPHVGTAYEKIGADALARFRRREGDEVRFQMGNDEHSHNVHKAAEQAGQDPKTYCDAMRKKFESIWQQLEISYDGFIQTSEPRHKQAVQALFTKIHKAGDIYQGHYEGWYCKHEERYWTEKDLVEGNCPDCGRPVQKLSEKNYFFRMSYYQQWLIDYINNNPNFIHPDCRANELLGLL